MKDEVLLILIDWETMLTLRSSHQEGPSNSTSSPATHAELRCDLNFPSFVYKAEHPSGSAILMFSHLVKIHVSH